MERPTDVAKSKSVMKFMIEIGKIDNGKSEQQRQQQHTIASSVQLVIRRNNMRKIKAALVKYFILYDRGYNKIFYRPHKSISKNLRP